MAIPKKVPGGDPRKSGGLPQNNPRPGLPRGPKSGSNPVGNSNRPKPDQNKPDSGRKSEVELPTFDSSDVPSASSQYDFGGSSSKPSRINNGNPYDSDDDDTFTSIPVDEQFEPEVDENERKRTEAEGRERLRLAQERRDQRERDRIARENKKSKPAEDELLLENEDNSEDEIEELEDEAPPVKRNKKSNKNKDAKGRNKFVDEEKLELKPFGGKRKLRVKELDGRANLRQRAKVIQIITLGFFLLVIVVAGKNAFFPQKALNAEQITGLINQTVDITEFPLENGKGFAQDFMKSYLTVNGSIDTTESLGYFYTGTFSDAESPNRSITRDFKQTIISGPTVYKSKSLTNSSASYTIGALVKPEAEGVKAPTDSSSAQFEFFNVNVYYDKNSDSFSITPDSPTLIPSVGITESTEVPEAKKLGLGDTDEELADEIKSVVMGFVKGYAVSSPLDHSNLDQYIVSSEDTALTKGLNKEFKFAGSEEDAIEYEAYPTADENEVKVAVTVRWRSQIGKGENSHQADYESNYVMTLAKQSNDKYLVSKFAPMYFAPEVEE